MCALHTTHRSGKSDFRRIAVNFHAISEYERDFLTQGKGGRTCEAEETGKTCTESLKSHRRAGRLTSQRPQGRGSCPEAPGVHSRGFPVLGTRPWKRPGQPFTGTTAQVKGLKPVLNPSTHSQAQGLQAEHATCITPSKLVRATGPNPMQQHFCISVSQGNPASSRLDAFLPSLPSGVRLPP